MYFADFNWKFMSWFCPRVIYTVILKFGIHKYYELLYNGIEIWDFCICSSLNFSNFLTLTCAIVFSGATLKTVNI